MLLALFWGGIEFGSEYAAPLVPYRLQARLGKEVRDSLVSGHVMCTGEEGLSAINGLANRLARAAGHKRPVTVEIVKGGPVNAFTLWKPEAVHVVAGKENIATFKKTALSERQYCTKCGGLTEAWRIAWMAYEHNVQWVPHGWNTAIGLAADLQLSAAMPVARYVEFLTPSPPGIPTLPAVDLIDVSCLYVSAPIDEVDAAQLKVGMAGRIDHQIAEATAKSVDTDHNHWIAIDMDSCLVSLPLGVSFHFLKQIADIHRTRLFDHVTPRKSKIAFEHARHFVDIFFKRVSVGILVHHFK